jgi:hypothetical protein
MTTISVYSTCDARLMIELAKHFRDIVDIKVAFNRHYADVLILNVKETAECMRDLLCLPDSSQSVIGWLDADATSDDADLADDCAHWSHIELCETVEEIIQIIETDFDLLAENSTQ